MLLSELATQRLWTLTWVEQVITPKKVSMSPLSAFLELWWSYLFFLLICSTSFWEMKTLLSTKNGSGYSSCSTCSVDLGCSVTSHFEYFGMSMVCFMTKKLPHMSGTMAACLEHEFSERRPAEEPSVECEMKLES